MPAIHEILARIDSTNIPLDSIKSKSAELQGLANATKYYRRSPSDVTLRVLTLTGIQFPNAIQGELIARLENLHCPLDLKYIMVATGQYLADLQRWWPKCPLSLRWLAMVTRSRSWIAYHELYLRSPIDLRWVAVHTNDPRWLHFCYTWNQISIQCKIQAVATNDIKKLRTDKFQGPSFQIWDCPVPEEMCEPADSNNMALQS